MSTNRKALRARRSAPPPPEPTENQMDEALIAFERAKVRYRLIQIHAAMFVVRVLPEMLSGPLSFSEAMGPDAYADHRFTDEASARQWREREIIREAITAGMRAKP